MANQIDNQLSEEAVLENFLVLTRQVKAVILRSDPSVPGGLHTAGELLADWLASMPKSIRELLGFTELREEAETLP